MGGNAALEAILALQAQAAACVAGNPLAGWEEGEEDDGAVEGGVQGMVVAEGTGVDEDEEDEMY